MDLTICLAFGNRESAVAVATGLERDEFLRLGTVTQLSLANVDDIEDIEPIYAEVVHNSYGEDGSATSFLYGGEELPDDEVLERFSSADWTRLTDEESVKVIENIVEPAAPNAATHEVALFVGDPAAGKLEGWLRVMNPLDPLIPMFGQRILLDPTDVLSESDELEDEEDLDEDFEDDELDDFNPDTDIDPTEQQSIWHEEDMLPVVIFYASKVGPGFAQVALWTRSFGPFTSEDLIAAGWERIDVTSEEMVEFDPTHRIPVALASHVDVAYDDEGDPYLVDYKIDNAQSITEEQFRFLPGVFKEHVTAQRELADIDSIIASWREAPPQDTK